VEEAEKKKRIHPELLRQLETAEAGDSDLQAVFYLKPSNPKQQFMEPEETEATVKRILKRVAKETGIKPEDSHIFRNFGSFVVAAPAQFVRKLLEQDEIASAVPNRLGDGRAGSGGAGKS
jgi:hypothetical protein